jgi:hypothetical protein
MKREELHILFVLFVNFVVNINRLAASKFGSHTGQKKDLQINKQIYTFIHV